VIKKVIAMKKLVFLLALSANLFFLLVPQQMQACSSVWLPKAGKIPTENANLLIIWRYSDDSNQVFIPPEETQETAKYRLPGLYPANGSTIPIWIMPYQEQLRTSFGGRAYISSDRNAFVTVAQSNPGMPLVFYHNEKVLKEYSYSEVEARRPKGYPCGYEWFKEIYFDESTGVLTIDHVNGDSFAYSIYTGEPTSVPFSKEKPSVFLWLIVGSLVLGAIWFNKQRKRRSRKQKSYDVIPE
jgi:hypothetical protein